MTFFQRGDPLVAGTFDWFIGDPLNGSLPIGSMYGIYAYIWLIFMVCREIYHTWMVWG